MTPKAFSILALITLAALIGAITTTASRSRGVIPDERAGERLVPALSGRVNDIAQIEITDKSGKLTVQRGVDTWEVVEKGGFPARFDAVRAVIIGLAKLTILEPMTADPKRFPRIDVQDPSDSADNRSRRLVLKDEKGGVVADVIIGRNVYSIGSAGGLFVRVPVDRSPGRAWLTEGSVDLPTDAQSWLDRVLIDIAADRVQSLSLTGGEAGAVTVARSAANSPPVLADIPADRQADPAKLERLLGWAVRLSADDVRREDGLTPDPKGRQLSLTTTDGLRVQVLPLTGAAEGRWWRLLVSADDAAPGVTDAARELARQLAWLNRFAITLPVYQAGVVDQGLEEFLQPPAKAGG